MARIAENTLMNHKEHKEHKEGITETDQVLTTTLVSFVFFVVQIESDCARVMQ
jgi:hypothetical protein